MYNLTLLNICWRLFLLRSISSRGFHKSPNLKALHIGARLHSAMIHPSNLLILCPRLGVLIEVNCETDFVARGEVFKELANDMAMQVAACSQVTVVDVADVPADVVEKERSIQMEKEDILTKPEAIR